MNKIYFYLYVFLSILPSSQNNAESNLSTDPALGEDPLDLLPIQIEPHPSY